MDGVFLIKSEETTMPGSEISGCENSLQAPCCDLTTRRWRSVWQHNTSSSVLPLSPIHILFWRRGEERKSQYCLLWSTFPQNALLLDFFTNKPIHFNGITFCVTIFPQLQVTLSFAWDFVISYLEMIKAIDQSQSLYNPRAKVQDKNIQCNTESLRSVSTVSVGVAGQCCWARGPTVASAQSTKVSLSKTLNRCQLQPDLWPPCAASRKHRDDLRIKSNVMRIENRFMWKLCRSLFERCNRGRIELNQWWTCKWGH